MPTQQQQDFLSTYGPLSQEIASETGLSPSVVLAQIAQETGWGQTVHGNNIFGITPPGGVASYPNVQDAARAYINLIRSNYGNAADAGNPGAQINALVAGGYNRVDPEYGQHVAEIANNIGQWTAPTAGEASYNAMFGEPTAAQGVAPQVPVTGEAAYSSMFGPQVAPASVTTPTETASAAPSSAAPVDPVEAAEIGGVPWLGTPEADDAIDAGMRRAGADVLALPVEGLNWVTNKLGYPIPALQRWAANIPAERAAYNSQYGSNPLATGARLVGDIGLTALPAGAVARGIEGAGTAALGAGPVANLLSSGLAGAAGGATAAGLTAGSSSQPLGQQLKSGAELGGALGAAVPVVSGLGSGIRNALVGGGTPPEVAQLAQLARNQYNIPVYGGQISTSPAVRFLDSVTRRMPFSGAGPAMEAQQSAFNQAVANSFGEDADKITPDVMARAKQRLGQQFDNIASQTNINADPAFLSDLANVETEAQSVLPAGEYKPISTQIDNLLDAASKNGNSITGEQYQALTRKGAPLDRAMQSNDPNVRFYAGRVRDALDNAMQRSASPDLQDQLSQARGQYKAMKTVEDLVEKSPTGDISPTALLGRVRASYGNMAYNGGGQLGDLARIGQQFLKEPPSSGTAERSMLYGGLMEAPAIFSHDPIMAAKIAGGIGASRALGSIMRSKLYTNALINNALRGGAGPISQFTGNALAAAPQVAAVPWNMLSAPTQPQQTP